MRLGIVDEKGRAIVAWENARVARETVAALVRLERDYPPVEHVPLEVEIEVELPQSRWARRRGKPPETVKGTRTIMVAQEPARSMTFEAALKASLDEALINLCRAAR